MRNILSTILSFSLLIGLNLHAQSAQELLIQLNAKYVEAGSFKADLSSRIYNDERGMNQEIEGKIALQGDQFLLHLGPQVLAFDGAEIYAYKQPTNEIVVKSYRHNKGDIGPNRIFVLHETEFVKKLKPEETVNGESCFIIEMTPDKPETEQIQRIELALSKKSLRPLRYHILDKIGNHYLYHYSNISMGKELPEALFVLDGKDYPEAMIVKI